MYSILKGAKFSFLSLISCTFWKSAAQQQPGTGEESLLAAGSTQHTRTYPHSAPMRTHSYVRAWVLILNITQESTTLRKNTNFQEPGN